MDMMNPYRIYELSFRGPSRKRRPPELVFSVSKKNFDKIVEYVRTSRIVEAVEIPEYLGECPSMSWMEPSLPLNKKWEPFGLARCAYAYTRSDRIEIAFPLIASNTMRLTKTLQILTWTLNHLIITNEELSNTFQLCEFSGRCDRSGQHSHSVGGNIYPVFRRWLAELNNERREAVEFKAAFAIRSAWYSLNAYTTKEKRRSNRLKFERFSASIDVQGRFGLHCPGDACDLSIYPDGFWTEDIDHFCEFGCHNLDSATQQLALLSGLAVLHMCAIEDQK